MTSRRLVAAQEAVVHEDTGELIAHGACDQRPEQMGVLGRPRRNEPQPRTWARVTVVAPTVDLPVLTSGVPFGLGLSIPVVVPTGEAVPAGEPSTALAATSVPVLASVLGVVAQLAERVQAVERLAVPT